MNFYEEIILSIIDKLLLGGLVILIGYIINRSLESYKSNILIKREFTIARINKISDTWKSIIELEENASKIIDIIVDIRQFIKSSIEEQSKAILKETNELDSDLKKQIVSISKQLEINQFWLGNEYYEKFSDYKNEIIDYYKKVIFEKDIITNEIKELLKDFKEDLFNVVYIQTKNKIK